MNIFKLLINIFQYPVFNTFFKYSCLKNYKSCLQRNICFKTFINKRYHSWGQRLQSICGNFVSEMFDAWYNQRKNVVTNSFVDQRLNSSLN